MTDTPEKRLAAHNQGRGAKSTKMRLPVKLVYVEEMSSRSEAMKREFSIKAMNRDRKKRLVKSLKQKSPDFAGDFYVCMYGIKVR